MDFTSLSEVVFKNKFCIKYNFMIGWQKAGFSQGDGKLRKTEKTHASISRYKKSNSLDILC
jgi:hypothetical protein